MNYFKFINKERRSAKVRQPVEANKQVVKNKTLFKQWKCVFRFCVLIVDAKQTRLATKKYDNNGVKESKFLIWDPQINNAFFFVLVDSRSTPINVLPTGKPPSGVTDVQGGLRAVIADAKQSRLVTEVDKKGVAPKSSIPNQAPSSTIKMLQFLYRLYQHYRTTAVLV